MKILQVNVRLHEGGAARIALNLHRQLLSLDVESRFGYGWGEKGGISSEESSVPFSFQIGSQIQVASNILLNTMTGIDFVTPSGKGRRLFLESMKWADVVHLHAIHSYYLPFSWVIKELIKVRKPIVWTAHDYWILTGRCASTEGCSGWLNGCGTCTTRRNYPPAYMDFSAAQFETKRQLISALGSALHIVAPSEFVEATIKKGFPSVNVRTIPNFLDTNFEAALSDVVLSSEPISFSADRIKVLIVANNLSDRTKVDRELIAKLLNLRHVELHTIGRNSPFVSGRVINHGQITQSKRMVEIIRSTDVSLFTSKKDTFGLVMIESLACGVPVLAVDSLAAQEVLINLGVSPIKENCEIINAIENRTIPACYKGTTREYWRDKVLSNFCSLVAANRYISVYIEAINEMN